MLLKVNKPACFDDLKVLETYVGELLDHIVHSSYSIIQPTEDLPSNFVTFLETKKSWPFVKRAEAKAAMKVLFTIQADERQQIRDAFFQDKDFVNKLSDPNFSFEILQFSEELTEVAEKFFVPFYNLLSTASGFRKFNHRKTSLKRQTLIDDYHQANRLLDRHRICPACLEDIRLIDGKSNLADVDHYFPKSIYPTLSINPDNLIPVCMSCNRSLKTITDPMHLAKGKLQEIFLPYRDFGLKKIKVSFKRLYVKQNQSNDAEVVEKVGISSIDPNDTTLDMKVNQFKNLFQLEAQWTGRLEGIFSDLLHDIKIVLKADYEPQDVRHALHIEYEKMRYKATTSPNAYLTGCYIRHLLHNDKEFEHFCKELKEWQTETYDDVLGAIKAWEAHRDVLGDLD